VVASCLNVAGRLDVTALGLACVTMPVTGLLRVTGSWTATSDGNFSDATTTFGEEQIVVPSQCVGGAGTVVRCRDLSRLFGNLGYASATCVDAQDDGDHCICPSTVNQSSGAGLVSFEPPAGGQYTTSGGVLTTDTGTQYSYCVSGNTMTWTPRSASPTVTGTIVLQKQ
jgi:hypothetical protein